MTLEEAENVLVKEFKKRTKLRDSALIARTQRDTLKQRRLFIEKKHGGSVEHLIKRFPFLRSETWLALNLNNWTNIVKDICVLLSVCLRESVFGLFRIEI